MRRAGGLKYYNSHQQQIRKEYAIYLSHNFNMGEDPEPKEVDPNEEQMDGVFKAVEKVPGHPKARGHDAACIATVHPFLEYLNIQDAPHEAS